MITNIGKEVIDTIVKDDPPLHLDTNFRISAGREVYALYDDKYAEFDDPDEDIKAVICVAYTNEVPKNEYELDLFNYMACPRWPKKEKLQYPHTVWSYSKRCR